MCCAPKCPAVTLSRAVGPADMDGVSDRQVGSPPRVGQCVSRHPPPPGARGLWGGGATSVPSLVTDLVRPAKRSPPEGMATAHCQGNPFALMSFPAGALSLVPRCFFHNTTTLDEKFPPTPFSDLWDVLLCCSKINTPRAITLLAIYLGPHSRLALPSQLNGCDLGYHLSARPRPRAVSPYPCLRFSLQAINLEGTLGDLSSDREVLAHMLDH